MQSLSPPLNRIHAHHRLADPTRNVMEEFAFAQRNILETLTAVVAQNVY